MSLPSFYDCDFILYVPSFHLYVPLNARLANLILASKFYASWKQRNNAVSFSLSTSGDHSYDQCLKSPLVSDVTSLDKAIVVLLLHHLEA